MDGVLPRASSATCRHVGVIVFHVSCGVLSSFLIFFSLGSRVSLYLSWCDGSLRLSMLVIVVLGGYVLYQSNVIVYSLWSVNVCIPVYDLESVIRFRLYWS